MRTLFIGLCVSAALGGAAMAQQSPAANMLVKLHNDLHLRPDQDGAWRQYIASMNDSSQIQAQRQSAEEMLPTLATPRRLALMEATMSQELADFRKESQAIRIFYDRLTPDQQKTFDRDTSPQQQNAGR